ncbi:MAG: FtsB family cell division protein [Hydrogenovibrio sp.]
MKIIYIAFAIVILILQVRLLSSDGGVGELMSLQNKLDAFQAKIDALEHQNFLLRKEVKDLQSNTQAIETIARQKLGMIGENEVFIKVVELPKVPAATEPSITSVPSPENPIENQASDKDSEPSSDTSLSKSSD